MKVSVQGNGPPAGQTNTRDDAFRYNIVLYAAYKIGCDKKCAQTAEEETRRERTADNCPHVPKEKRAYGGQLPTRTEGVEDRTWGTTM